MGDANYAAEVVRMTVKNTSLPVSVKLRAVDQGEASKEKLIEFVHGLQEAGASWICLHPRTAVQKRRGQADWSQIQWLKKTLNIPVIGNGDIQFVDDVFQMKKETNCDLVMSGRALAARPWMFWQVGERLGMPAPKGRQGLAPKTGEEEGAEYGRALLQLVDECELIFSADLAIRKIRFYIRTSHVWLIFGHSLMALAHKAQSLPQLRISIREFFQSPQPMVQRTDLRQ